jgi:hypothetical protein
LIVAGTALAKNEHHSDGHNLLGAKPGQNGKHEIGKIGNNAVAADVNNKKGCQHERGQFACAEGKSNKKMARLAQMRASLLPGAKVVECSIMLICDMPGCPLDVSYWGLDTLIRTSEAGH